MNIQDQIPALICYLLISGLFLYTVVSWAVNTSKRNKEMKTIIELLSKIAKDEPEEK